MFSERGDVSREQLQALTGTVWDGNNHVFMQPNRAEAYCSESDVEALEWGSITWAHDDPDGRRPDVIDVAPGWVQSVFVDGAGRRWGQQLWDGAKGEPELSREEAASPDSARRRVTDYGREGQEWMEALVSGD